MLEPVMKTCLVVDDSRVIRTIARRMLEELSFSVREAVNGQDALDSCLDDMPEVILLDWNMPVMSGIDFLRRLRKSDGGADPVVIFCTTVNDVDHIRIALEAGANEYIMKPFDSEILQTKFSQVGVL